MFCIRLLSACAVLAACCAPRAAAQVPADDPQVEPVRQAAAAYLKAREEGNRDALLAAWTLEGSYVDAVGRSRKARELIESEFASGQASARKFGSIVDEKIRLVTPDVAILDGTTLHLAAPGESAPKSRYTAVLVKRDGRWLLDSLRESVIPLPPLNSHLTELRWLLGSFSGLADDGSYVLVSTMLSNDGNFFLRDFVIRVPDDSRYTISQRIGWDPVANGFRCWTFDSQGGFSDGTWKRQADCWIVNTSGVTSDGKRTAATSLYTGITEEGFVLEIVGAMLDNQSKPDIKVKMIRQTPQDE